MSKLEFPVLDVQQFASTKEALHAYSSILGAWASVCRARRKHWWHASLRPSLNGLTTGVLYTENVQFEIELNFRTSTLAIDLSSGKSLSIELNGQAVGELVTQIEDCLLNAGVSAQSIEMARKAIRKKNDTLDVVFDGYSAEQADKLARALSAIAATLESFRAGLREESSPIQLWPHHFDLAMLWLPGDKIADQDPDNEEYADKQMNFGFAFGDEGIAEPYFYVTAYPTSEAFAALDLPAGTEWKSQGFTGAVLTYQALRETADPGAYLLDLWSQLLATGKAELISPID